MPFTYRLLSSIVPPNSLRITGLFPLITLLALFSICVLLIAPLAYRVPIAMYITLRIKWSSIQNIWFTYIFLRMTPSQLPLNLFPRLLIDFLIKLSLGRFNEKFLMVFYTFQLLFSHFPKFAFDIFWVDCLIY